MTDLTPITALGGTLPRSEVFGALSLTEQPDLALASLSLRKGQGVPTPFGLTLPGVGQSAQAGEYSALWIGRDQWMIEVADTRDLAALLKAELPEASITEQTDGFAAFEITSSDGAAPLDEMMRKLVNLDPLAFGPGRATRSTIEHIGVFLVRRAADRLAVIGMRTYAGALWHALTVAARRLDT